MHDARGSPRYSAASEITRLSNGFSRKRANLRAALALFFAYYNLVKVHRAIRMTPGDEGRPHPEALDGRQSGEARIATALALSQFDDSGREAIYGQELPREARRFLR